MNISLMQALQAKISAVAAASGPPSPPTPPVRSPSTHVTFNQPPPPPTPPPASKARAHSPEDYQRMSDSFPRHALNGGGGGVPSFVPPPPPLPGASVPPPPSVPNIPGPGSRNPVPPPVQKAVSPPPPLPRNSGSFSRGPPPPTLPRSSGSFSRVSVAGSNGAPPPPPPPVRSNSISRSSIVGTPTSTVVPPPPPMGGHIPPPPPPPMGGHIPPPPPPPPLPSMSVGGPKPVAPPPTPLVPQHSPKHRSNTSTPTPPPPPPRTPTHTPAATVLPMGIPPPPHTPTHTATPVLPMGVPPPPPPRTPTHTTTPVLPMGVPPPPPPRTPTHTTSPVLPMGIPPPPIPRTPTHTATPELPSGIPPPPVLQHSHSPSPSTPPPPPPPVRKSSIKRHSGSPSGPPPPPRRSSSSEGGSQPSSPKSSATVNRQPTPPTGPHPSKIHDLSPGTPPLPPIRRVSSYPDPKEGKPDDSEGGGDYDVPRSLLSRDQDYDIPVSQKERLSRGKAAPANPSDGLYSRLQPRASESSSSGGSRPLSQASSVYSADSSSLSSSHSGSKLVISKDDGDSAEYDIPKPSKSALQNLDSQMEMIEQLVEDVAEQNGKKRNPAPYELQTLGKVLSQSARSSFSENESSRSGSNDNLGVWDDYNYEEEEDTSGSGSGEGEAEEGVGGMGEKTLLDSWIMELETGMKGMAEVAGLGPTEQPEPPTPTQAPLPPTAPPSEVDPTAPVLQKEGELLEHEALAKKDSGTVVKRRRTSKTEKELARHSANWRLSFNAVKDADDPDLDALLADLCKLEEDTIAEMASANYHTAGNSLNVPLTGPPLSPTAVMNGPGEGDSGMSSDDFVNFMKDLQSSKDIILDPTRHFSSAMLLADQSKGAHSSEPSDLGSVEEQKSDRGSIFSGDGNPPMPGSTSRTSTLQRQSSRTSTLPRNGRQADSEVQSPTHAIVKKQLDAFAEQLTIDESLTPEQQVQKLKNEKIKMAMMKLKEASVQKMVLKVHNIDGSTKMVAIHEGMNARSICILLAERNHQELGPNWTLVEKLNDLHLERTLEDHERVLEKLSHWPRVHDNCVLFKNNPEKYYLLKRPQLLMPASHVYSSVNPTRTAFSEEQKKNIILKELFKTKVMPSLGGDLYIREGKKSGWKKHLFVFRASGLYYSKSGKSMASKDIVRVAEWKDVECYTGNQYKKFYRAPGPHCFSLVPYGTLLKMEKQIIHICTPTKHDLVAWMTLIRLAKCGDQLQQNYEDTKSEMPWLQLEEENLDELMSTAQREGTLSRSKDSKASEMEAPAIVLQNGRELSHHELASAHKKGSLRGNFQFKSTENGSAKASERDSTVSSISSPHVITGPISDEVRPARRTRPQQNTLANAFGDAWKKGSLAAEMSHDGEKWPSFRQGSISGKNRPKLTKQRSHDHLNPKESIPFDEASGMFTLKRRDKDKKEKENGNSLVLPRTASISSTVSLPVDPTSQKNRVSQTGAHEALY